nr:15449_t:CDS:2 [Entrophospora candida]
MVSQRLIKQRESLPIYPYKQQIIEAIQKENLLVIIGETGSGKTTQIPQYILESYPDCKLIGVTQPRRIAAITVANRVSEEQGSKLGEDVGYCIRFDDCTSSKTRLKYMTDGVLLREATLDPNLRHYDIIIIDEETDVLFGLLKTTHRLRPELKILVMSATLNVEKFADFFDGCSIFMVPGRTYEVSIIHHRETKISSLKSAFVQRAIETSMYIHTNEPPGDVLVFLTGQNEIERACREILAQERDLNYRKDVKYYDKVRGLVVYPIYANLETFEQKSIFEEPPRGIRKIVFSTNIAQVKYVIDSGFVKQKMYEPSTGMDALLVVPISQAAATQRAGRAGRTAPGKAFRLYNRESYEQMIEETVPEIQRSSLLGTVLSLKKIGIKDILGFEFIDPPDSALVKNALKQLFLLEAINENGNLTELGEEMTKFPLNPFLSRVLVASAKQLRCSKEVAVIVAMLSVEEIFVTPRDQDKLELADEMRREFYHPSGDHMTLLNVFDAYRDSGYSREWCREKFINYRSLSMARNIRDQLYDLMKKSDLPIISCRITEDERRSGDGDQHSHKKRRTKQSYHRKYDHELIIESFSSSYYINLAKVHSHKPIFYHYISSTSSNDSVDSNSSLLALNISPTSSLHPDNKIVRMENLDWVIYHSILYTTKAIMKITSRIRFEWVQKRLELLKKLEKARLDESLQSNENKTGDEDNNKNDDDEEAIRMSIEEDNKIKERNEEVKNKRQETIEAARQRALQRRSFNQL